MFIQVHMLQSMPPGNLNRDEVGQPKMCLFGGVARGRISSQCQKRHMRRSPQMREAFGDALADRTTYLPRMIVDELRNAGTLPESELPAISAAVATQFRKETKGEDAEDGGEEEASDGRASAADAEEIVGKTGQLVFFPASFAAAVREILLKFREEQPRAFQHFIGTLPPKTKKEDAKALEREVKALLGRIAEASKKITVDIGLFGRMTTSDLVVNVEAACQVAHAIATHETIMESDYFTAMDDRKAEFEPGQVGKGGAAFLGSGETETFFNAAVYYRYLNLDLDALRSHLSFQGKAWPDAEAKKAVGALVMSGALSTPTGKQNSFASHGMPELVLVEVSGVKRPISYANAFLRPVDGPNYLEASAAALKAYVESVAPAFAPSDTRRYLLAVGHADTDIDGATRVRKLDELAAAVGQAAIEGAAGGRG